MSHRQRLPALRIEVLVNDCFAVHAFDEDRIVEGGGERDTILRGQPSEDDRRGAIRLRVPPDAVRELLRVLVRLHRARAKRLSR